MKNTLCHSLFLAIAIAFVFSGCATNRTNPTVYESGETHRVFRQEHGTVASVRSVIIKGDTRDNWIGRWGGGAVGAAVPWSIWYGRGGGGYYSGGIWAISAVSAIGGAILGDTIENAVTTHRGQEIQVTLDKGKTIIVVQENKPRFATGVRLPSPPLPSNTDGKGVYDNNNIINTVDCC